MNKKIEEKKVLDNKEIKKKETQFKKTAVSKNCSFQVYYNLEAKIFINNYIYTHTRT